MNTLTLIELADWLATQRGDFARSLHTYFLRNGRLTERQEAAARRMWEQANRPAPEVAHDRPTETGFYFVDGTVYKVKRSQAGNLYVMVRLANGDWEYVRGGLNVVPATAKVTPEVAAQHGLETGICLFCNAELDDADGLGARVGVGPVCCRKHLGLTQRQLAQRLGV